MKRFVWILLVWGVRAGLAVASENSSQYSDSPPSVAVGWKVLEPGLQLGTFLSPHRATTGDSLIHVLRIDPLHFEFRLLNASNPEYGRPLTAKMWCQQYGLTAAINASMYQADHRTSVSLMSTKNHTNNPRLSKDKSILVFDRQTSEVPLVKIIDRECEDFALWKDKYGTFVQNIRMISCKGENVWAQQAEKRSTAVIGSDEQGNFLFIHVRSPFSTHDLINILMKLPLGISRAMYTEGGAEAQLYVQSGGNAYEFVGTYGDGFSGSLQNGYVWPIPNVVGIARRELVK